jgi:PHD/YefM family antitoxin component YafN of YafNO toxin-antitoxin module
MLYSASHKHSTETAMQMSPLEDIRSVTDLKRNTREILDHIHSSGRPVFLTMNGRADSVIMDAKVWERHLQAGNMARLLAQAEGEVAEGTTRAARDFFQEFRRVRDIQG